MADHQPPYLFGRRPQIAAGGEFGGSLDSLRSLGMTEEGQAGGWNSEIRNSKSEILNERAGGNS
jgi:hypothetical protein